MALAIPFLEYAEALHYPAFYSARGLSSPVRILQPEADYGGDILSHTG